MTDPGRRTFLRWLGGAALLTTGGLVAYRAFDEGGGEPSSSTTTTLPSASPHDALVVVGGRYLAEHPDEADRERLLAALPALEGEVPEHPLQGLQVLADQAAADHRTGDVVELDGWVLSLTECRAAALYAL